MRILTASGALVIFFMGLLTPAKVVAQEYTCQIKAVRDNVHVFVRDFDRDGNPTRRTIYRGWILRGRSVPIKSLSGRISYNYRADSDYRGSGRNEDLCTGNRTIIVP